jgi:hypothetical protein
MVEEVELRSKRHWICINLRERVAWVGQAFAHPDIAIFSAGAGPAEDRRGPDDAPWQDREDEDEQ